MPPQAPTSAFQDGASLALHVTVQCPVCVPDPVCYCSFPQLSSGLVASSGTAPRCASHGMQLPPLRLLSLKMGFMDVITPLTVVCRGFPLSQFICAMWPSSLTQHLHPRLDPQILCLLPQDPLEMPCFSGAQCQRAYYLPGSSVSTELVSAIS